MKIWSRAPLMRIVIPLGIGIICSITVGDIIPLIIPISFFIVLLSLSILFHRSKGLKISFGPYLSSFFIWQVLFFSGFLLAEIHNVKNNPNDISKYTNLQEGKLCLKVIKPVSEREKSVRCLCETQAFVGKEGAKNAEGKLLLYLEKDSSALHLKYGDIIFIPNKIKTFDSSRIPYSFDYRQYMAYKDIYYTAYIQSDEWQKTAVNKGNILMSGIYLLKNKVKKWIREPLTNADERGVATALLLGDTDELQPEIKKSYSSTGTMHVLAVSGMHVGVFALMLNFFLKFLGNSMQMRILRSAILIFSLLFYMLITGLSPSVCRAVAMFCFIIIGTLFNRMNNIYNSIAASALLLLIIDPYVIMQTGFQLSYAAVLGIVWLQPKFSALWQISNKAGNWIWQALCTSLAAQITTFPLTLYYFGQFPLYFLISNLLIIFPAIGILWTGIAFIFFKLIGYSFLYSFVGWVWFLFIHLLNDIVQFMESLPFSSLKGLYVNFFDTLLLYIFMATVLGAIFYKRKKMWTFSLFTLLLLCVLKITDRHLTFDKKELMVLSIAGNPVLSLKNGNDFKLLASKKLLTEKEKIEYNLKSYYNRNYLSENRGHNFLNMDSSSINENGFYFKPPFGQFDNFRFLILSDRNQLIKLNKTLPTMDLVVLENSPKLSIKDVLEKVSTKKLLIANNNWRSKVKEWERDCKELNINFTKLSKDDSFVMNFE